MIVSLLYRAGRALLSVPADLLCRVTAMDAELPALRRTVAGHRRDVGDP
ncbi:hypothetical protein [Streptomyces sp. MUSC 14]|nr:hypothetical protein [Streptomyces sp. MUSC 14]